MADTIEQKALALVDKTRRDSNLPKARDENVRSSAAFPALCRAIEQHEAFRQEVSAMLIDEYGEEFCRDHSRFARFILAEPDPLVEALKQLKMSYVDAEDFRAALAVRGLEIREKARV